MKKLFSNNYRLFANIFMFTTLVFFLLSLTFLGQIFSLHEQLEAKPEDLTVEGEAEDTEYTAYIASLETENEELKNTLQEISSAQEEDGEVVVIDENEEKRQELHTFVEEFTLNFFQRTAETDLTRRDRLAEYVDVNILNAYAPEDNPTLDMLPLHDTDNQDLVDLTDYEITVEETTIYHDESTLNEDVIDVLINVSTSTRIDDYEPSKQNFTANLKVEENDGDFTITNIYFSNLEEPSEHSAP